jgi:hypothetical protein
MEHVVESSPCERAVHIRSPPDVSLNEREAGMNAQRLKVRLFANARIKRIEIIQTENRVPLRKKSLSEM